MERYSSHDEKGSMLKAKRVFWIGVSLLILAFVFHFTNATQLPRIDVIYFVASLVFFLLSTVFWGAAWGLLARMPLRRAIRLNTASLAGFFAPAGLGGDAIRTHLASKDGLASRALATSFIAKFFKLTVVAILLAASMVLLNSYWRFDFYFTIYSLALLLTLLGAAAFISPALLPGIFKRLSAKFMRGKGDNFILEFKRSLRQQSAARIAAVFLLLLFSGILEFVAVYAALVSAGALEDLTKAFVLSSLINSLTLITITPQGLGFVEGGSYLLLTSGYWAVAPKYAGSFLITWNLIRLWLPAMLGAVVAFFTEGRKK
ncbi:flippase-like domain-containing protein [archaeon]|nr:flippase-like domain-containing protein [archaeon]